MRTRWGAAWSRPSRRGRQAEFLEQLGQELSRTATPGAGDSLGQDVLITDIGRLAGGMGA